MLKRSDEMNHKSVMEALGSIPGMGSLTGVPSTGPKAGKVDPKSLRIDETNAKVSRITGMQLDECDDDPEMATEEEDEVEEDALASTDDDAPAPIVSESSSYAKGDWESLIASVDHLMPDAKRLLQDVKKFYLKAAGEDVELQGTKQIEAVILSDIDVMWALKQEAQAALDAMDDENT